MKYRILILTFLILFSCAKKEKEFNNIIKEFIEAFFVNEDYDFNMIENYMVSDYKQKYNSLTDKNKKIHNGYIKSSIRQIRASLIANNFKYEIIKIEDLSPEVFSKEIVYHGNGEIYALKLGDELLIFFVIEKNKLYSFCTDVYLSSKNTIVPYFFFDEQKLIQR